MSLVSRLATAAAFVMAGGGLPAAPENRDPSDDFWWGPRFGGNSSGVRVDPDSGITVPLVNNALTLLADNTAGLPLICFQRRPDGTKNRDETHPVAPVLRHLASDEVTAFEFRSQMQHDLAWHRNAFALIHRGRRGAVEELEWVSAKHVMVSSVRGRRVYRVSIPGRAAMYLTTRDVWHLRRSPLTDDGLCGRPVWETGAEAIGQAILMRGFSARFYRNDARTPYFIMHPEKFADKAARETWWTGFIARITGGNKGKPGLLEFGMDVKSVPQTSPADAQFTETMREVNYDLARLWNMPPHKLGLLERSTNNNIETQAIEFVVDALSPWLVLWEQAIKRDLLGPDNDWYAEHNVSGLLRGDIRARYEAYAKARQWGWLSANDVRKLENMNPVEGGGSYYQPLNMVPVGDDAPKQEALRVDANGRVWRIE